MEHNGVEDIITELDPDLEICYICKGLFSSKKIIKSMYSRQRELGSTTIVTNYCTRCAVEHNVEVS